MRGAFLGWWLGAALLPGAVGASDGAPTAAGVYDLKLVPLGHEVFLLQRPDVFRQPVEPNAVFIVNDRDVVVVDAGGSPLAAENAIRQIRSITRKPVSVVVNTHWHGDHNLGNEVYRREFPSVRIAAHRNTLRDMTGKPMDYVRRYPKMLADYIAELEVGLASDKLSAAQEGAQRAELADVKVMAAEFGRVKVSPPDWVFDSEITLQRGARTIQVMHLGRGNTEGDVVVWLPAERILASGDLVVAPIPYGFGSFPEQWLATLDRLKAFDFDILVPGHGEVMRDRVHIEAMQAMLRSARAKATLAVAHGTDLAAFKAALDFTPFARGLIGEDPRRQMLFKAWWTDPIARSAWLEARGEPILQGASDETG